MRVKDLIQILEEYPPDLPVTLTMSNPYDGGVDTAPLDEGDILFGTWKQTRRSHGISVLNIGEEISG